MATKDFLDVEDLEVYKKLCRLHIEVCDLTPVEDPAVRGTLTPEH